MESIENEKVDNLVEYAKEPINEDNLPVIIGEVGREVSYTTLNRNINLDGIAYHE
jgi:hypothetical protein